MTDRPLPDWLAASEPYEAPPVRDAFIDRSLLAFLALLSHLHAGGFRTSSARRAHAFFRLSFTLLAVLLVSLSRTLPFVLVALAVLLCRLALLPGAEIAKVLRNGLVAAAFTAVVLLPAGFLGDWTSLVRIVPKVFVSVSALGLLVDGTRWNELTQALKYFFIPDLFLFVLDIAVRYIALLGDAALSLLQALRLRSVGRPADRTAALSGVAGVLYLHSRELATEMHAAMECRGFTGEYRRPARFGFDLADGLLVAAAAGMVLVFIVLSQGGSPA